MSEQWSKTYSWQLINESGARTATITSGKTREEAETKLWQMFKPFEWRIERVNIT